MLFNVHYLTDPCLSGFLALVKLAAAAGDEAATTAGLVPRMAIGRADLSAKERSLCLLCRIEK